MSIYLKNVNPTILGNADPTIEVVQSLTVGSKIGIGTAAPTDKLQLDSAGGANFRITNTTNSRYALFGLDSTGSFVKNSNNGNTFRLINANGLAAFTADYSTEGFTFVGATNSLLRAYAPSVARFIFQNDARSYSISTESTNFHVVDQTASATRMTMNSSGHVCFGSGAPRSLLDLGVDGSALVIGGAGSGGQLRFGANADANSIQYSDSEFAFRTNQSNGHRFYVNGEKRLEIGGSNNSSNERKVTIYGRFQLTNGSSTGMYFNVSENENQAFIGREGGAGSRLSLYYNGWKFRVNSDNAVFSTDVVMDSQRIYLMPNKEVSTDYTGGIAWSSEFNSYGIFKSSGGWSHPYPDLRIAFHTGIQIGGYFGYGGTRFYNNSDMATEIFSVGNGDNLVRVAQGLLVTSGNVGIGTTSALAALDMGSGGIRLGGVIRTSWPAEPWVAAGSNIYYNTGNVGIGTTVTSANLQIGDAATSGRRTLLITDSGYGLQLYGGNGNGVVESRGVSVPLEFRSSNGNDGNYLFTSTGKVGIGTTGPGHQLQLGTNFNGVVSGGKVFINQGAFNAWNGKIAISPDGNAAVASVISSYHDTTNNIQKLGLGTIGYSGVEQTMVLQNGNVGIGTTSPITRLNLGSYTGSRLPYINGTVNTFNANGITVTSSNTANAAIGGGLDLTNNVHSVGSFSPLISFSALSQSGTYNNNYAAIYGILAGDSGDGNWNTGHLVFATTTAYGASEKVRITSAGNVGIGTVSPTRLLHVSNTTLNTPAGYFGNTRDGGSDNALIVENSNSGGSAPVMKIIGQGTGDTLQIFDTATQVFTVKDGGNVGIGTTAPTAKLQVSYTSVDPSFDPQYSGLNLHGNSSVRLLFGTAPGSPYAAWIQTSNTGSAFPLSLNPLGGSVGIGTTTPGANAILHLSGAGKGLAITDTNGSVSFGWAYPNTTTLGFYSGQAGTPFSTNLFNITSSGFVGIGTVTPSYKLQVKDGTIAIERSNGCLAQIVFDGGNVFRIDTNTQIFIGSNASGGNLTLQSGTGGAYTNLKVNGGTEAVRIVNNGDVGIGTSTPTQKLEVNGTVKVTTLMFSSDGSIMTAAGGGGPHTHTAADIVSGTVATARLGSGTATSGNFLRGDSTWVTISGGGNMLSANNLSELTATQSTARSNIGLGTMATQAASAVAVTGGTINGATVGATTPAAITGATLQVNGTSILSGVVTVQGHTVGKGGGAIYTNQAFGTNPLASNTTGSGNTAIGTEALVYNTSGDYNTSIGTYSSRQGTIASRNIAVGGFALQNNVTGNDNVAIGYQALNNSTTSNSIAIGRAALQVATTGGGEAVGYMALSQCTTGNGSAFGVSALYANTTGTLNSAFGNQSLSSSTTGSNNSAFGALSGNAITTGSNNSILGSYTGNQGGLDIRTLSNYIVLSDGSGNPRLVINSSGQVGIGTTSPTKALEVATDAKISGLAVGKGLGSISSNTAVGASALNANTSGYQNAAFGYQSLLSNTTGLNNAAFGYASLSSNIGGFDNVAVGQSSLFSNTSGSGNTAVGKNSLYYNTTGGTNTAIGQQACQNNTTGGANTGVGYGSLVSNTTGSNNTGVGLYALNGNTTANNNTAVGTTSLYRNTTGTSNTAVGYGSLYTLTTGGSNTLLGDAAGYNMTTGGSNTGVGTGALQNSTTASQNVAVGQAALVRVSTGGANTGIGQSAFEFLTTGTGNTSLGQAAGYSATTGLNNTFIGYRSGDAITTGGKNTLLGKYNGNEGGLDIRTLSNYIVLSDGDGTPRLVVNSTGNVGIGTTAPGAKLEVYGGDGLLINSTASSALKVKGGAASLGRLIFADQVGDAGYIDYDHNIDAWYFRNAGDTKVTILTSGNVGIGTTSPGTALQVVGTVTATTFSGSAASLTAFPTLNQNTTGSAATLTTSRTITLTGAVTGSVGFNGSADVSITTSGGATITSISDQVNSSTGYLDVPSGTTAQRPASPTSGNIRYNSSLSAFEFYNGTSWSSPSTVKMMDVLIAAGGGGGPSGGGGGGGCITTSIAYATSVVTVGAGGAAGANGGNSTAFAMTALGGGRGGNQNGNGVAGGCGGGGGNQGSDEDDNFGGSGTSGQGFNGGSMRGGSGSGAPAAGGGGAGSPGAGVNGGGGRIWVNRKEYCSGGSGGSSDPSALGLFGNGGRSNGAGTAGVVIIRYYGAATGTGGTITSEDGFTYHTFTSGGTFTAA